MPEKIPILILAGPTGIGKSDLAQKLALKLNTSIIHADSRQIYRQMDIGTAKPDTAMREQVSHHLLDIIEPDETFSAGKYKEAAAEIIGMIRENNRIPVIEGGTGLYIRSLIDGLFDGPPANQEIRDRLYLEAQAEGILYQKLARVDEAAAARLHPNDTTRIVRALEVFELTGKPISYWHQNMPPSPYEPYFFGLTAARELLYKWIDERVDRMMMAGLVEEVEHLLKRGYSENLGSMQTLGYKEIIGYLKGEYNLAEGVRLLKRNSRHYAKRQFTWFGQDKRIKWYEVTQHGENEKIMEDILSKFL